MKKGLFIAVAAAVIAVFAGLQIVPAEGNAEYIGGKKCKMCHIKQHKTWEAMKHAAAFSSLQGDEAKNPDCVKCHVTGYGEGGYEIGAANAADFENVQCEACHGPGSKHMKAPKAEKKNTIERKSTRCSGCHNPHMNMKEEAMKLRGK